MWGKSKYAWLFLVCFGAAQAAPFFVYSPYKFLPQSAMAPGRHALSWAFATGECGAEHWGKEAGAAVAAREVPRFVAARKGYIVSTGGEGGVFTCASDAGMRTFIDRYRSPQLLGFDFDIEASQTPAQIDALVARLKTARQREPLRISFTIAAFAAADGSKKSLNPTGEAVLAATRKHGLDDALFNLMVMDFGPAAPNTCVVREGRCDMAASALQAARSVHEKYGLPYARIELTAMIGVNDVVENVFTLDDARALAKAAHELGLAGLHYWSLDRDTPCADAGAQPHCSGLPHVPAGAFETAFDPYPAH